MRPGDIHAYGGHHRAIALTVGLFAKRQGRQIHIHIAGTRGHKKGQTTVTNDPNSKKRYHPTLFRDLKAVLIANDRWQLEDE